jgi:cytochrome c2
MADRARKLNVVFALTSIAMLVAFTIMIWADYDREWKKYQKAFNKLEVKVTEAQAKQAKDKVPSAQQQALQAEMDRAKQEEAQRRAQIKKAQAERDKLEGEWYAVDQDYRFTKAEIDVKRYEYEEAAHKNKGNKDKKFADLRDYEKRWDDLRLKLEDVNARKDAKDKEIAQLEATRLDAEKKSKELFVDYNRFEDRLQKIKPGFVTTVRNLPVLDLANPSLKVNQIMPANLQDDVIFSGTPKVDRCTTCHLGIDKKGFENEKQPFTTHPEPRLLPPGPASHRQGGLHVVPPGTRTRDRLHERRPHPLDGGAGEGLGQELQPLRHLPSLPLLGLPDDGQGPHGGPVREVPSGPGRDPQGGFAQHRPPPLREVRLLRLPQGQGLGRPAQGGPGPHQDRLEDERGMDLPLDQEAQRLPPHAHAAGVGRAHARPGHGQHEGPEQRRGQRGGGLPRREVRTRDLPDPPAGDLAQGRKTFETIGCLACHRVGPDRRGVDETLPDGTTRKGLDAASFRTHGPNLDGTGSKVNAGWLYAWVRNPKGYWHDTRMPNLRLTDKEAADLTAYLMSLKNDAFMAQPRPPLQEDIRNELITEHLLAANVPVAEADRQLKSMDDHQKTIFVGEKTIGRYGCFGCHNISGFEKASPIGVELTEEGSKLVERLDFGFEEGKIPHTLPGWVHRKVMEPRVFDEGKHKRPEELLRMPKFGTTDEEAEALVTAVMSFTKEQVPLAAQKQLSADERYIERGARLVRDKNCRACHVLGEQGGAIRAIVADQLEAQGLDTLTARTQTVAFSPPLLYNADAKIGEGARVQTDWLHGFLSDPSHKIRPWVELRMPTFEFTEDELNVLTRYFAAMDKVSYPYSAKPQPDPTLVAAGRDLFGRWQCVKCHVVAGKLPNQPPENMAPDLANVPRRLRAEWLHPWLADPGKIQPGTRMPANFPKDAAENAYPEVLGGDQAKQIEAVTQYLMTLGQGTTASSATPPARATTAGQATSAGGPSR